MSNYVTFIRFIVVGISNTVVDWLLFFFFVSLSVPQVWAQTFAYSAGVINSYMWNRIWTFRVKGPIMKQFVRFLMLNFCSLMVTIIVLYGCNQMFSVFFSKFMATISGIVINWIGSRMWVFSGKTMT
ncbi:GtrA family protein [Anoxybacillus sp. D401a]|uniref:GtrA family protein n=1 Tax=Anoxybacillus sp. D401a TaxID=575112 RepID=UPI003D34FCE7